MKTRKTLAPHFHELKKRLLKIVFAFFIFFAVGGYFSTHIFQWLAMPLVTALKNQGLPVEMIYTNLTEAFSTYIETAFFAALLLTFPYLEWHLWRFASPGLLPKEKKGLRPILLAAPLLFIAGALLCYTLVIPNIWQFFIQFSNQPQPDMLIRLLAKMDAYLHTTMKLIFTFGLCFQLPLIMVLLSHIGLGSAASFSRKRRFVVVGIFLLAAILTPPDVLSQIMLALPLWGLYEISIILLKLKERGPKNA